MADDWKRIEDLSEVLEQSVRAIVDYCKMLTERERMKRLQAEDRLADMEEEICRLKGNR